MTPKDRQMLIAKNSFCRNPKSKDRFEKYFRLLLERAKEANSLEEKNSWTEEADLTLSVFCEKAKLSGKVIMDVELYQKELGDELDKVDELMDKQVEKENNIQEGERKKIEQENKYYLGKLTDLLGEIETVYEQSAFDLRLNRLAEYEGKLNKECFTEDQRRQYDSLTKDFSKVVSKKVNELNTLAEKNYNFQALNEFHYVYEEYKGNEKKYKEYSDLKKLVSRLFRFTGSRLTTEVQLYYNQVYSYIFGKLNDEDKFKLTALSLQVSKDQ